MIDSNEEALRAFFYGEDPHERRLRIAIEGIRANVDTRREIENDWLFEALETIGTDLPQPEMPAHLQSSKYRAALTTYLDPHDDPDVIWHKPTPKTAYDRAIADRVKLEKERDELASIANPTKAQRARLSALPQLIELAYQKHMALAKEDDETRTAIAETPAESRRDYIDNYRKTEAGKAARRKVRDHGNSGYTDLSELTPEQKANRKAEQDYISKLRKRLEAGGLYGVELDEEVNARVIARRAKLGT